MADRTDYYRILQVTPMAGETQIKRAYRALAKQYHPDRVPPERQAWAREQMARINRAYETLSDPPRRAAYDHAARCGHAAPVHDAPPPATSIWHAQRLRERTRRRQIERWRAVTAVSAVLLCLGLLLTLLFVKTQPGYLLAACVNGGVFLTMIWGLVMANR